MSGRIGLAMIVLIGLGGLSSAYADDSPQHRAPRALEQRIATYTRTLQLTPDQQSQLRGLLVRQGEQLRRIWRDSAQSSGSRIQLTRAVTGLTSDRIRALLTEEQRKKYNAPRHPRPEAAMTGPSVEDWMYAAGPR
jgi:hypothetical protein